MPRLRHTVEQIPVKLHEAEVATGKRESIQKAHLQDPVRSCARTRWKRVP